MKSIAIITQGMKKGGAERVISLLANYLVDKGIEVNIYVLTDSKCEYELLPQINLIPLDSRIFNQKSIFKIINQMINLRKAIKQSQPDITLVLPEEISAIVVPALLGLNTSIVLSDRNNPLIMPRNKVKRLLRFLFYRYAKGYVFQTKEARSYFSKKIKEKSKIIPNPLSSNLLSIPISNNRKKEIVAVGRLEEQKNFSLLINAFNQFNLVNSEYELKIYGEGSLREELEQQIKSLSLENKVKLPGKRDDIFNHIKDASLFVMSSNYEGLPNALIEAMALGIPVISTDCSCGPKEIIQNEENGILVPIDNVEEMTNAIQRVLESPTLSDKLSENGRDIINKLNPDVVLNEWLSYFQYIINNK